jgi:hypothetical protein
MSIHRDIVTDPNMRRLLDYVHRENPGQRHYAMLRIPDVRDHSGTEKLLRSVSDKIFVSGLDKLGVTPLYAYGWAEMAPLVSEIRRNR